MDVHNFIRATKLEGITLIELLISLALISILLSWGAPNLISLYHRNELSSEANTLLTHLMHTRSEAMKRNLAVVICRSEDGDRCLRSSSSRADWSMGWLIYANADDDKVRDPAEPIIKIGNKLPSNISLHFNQWWRLTFRPTGRTSNGTFTFCDPGGNVRRIIIYRSGRFRMSSPDVNDVTNPCRAS